MIRLDKERSMQSQKGFTLIEMIVAVTLVAMMAAGLWSIFRTGIRSWSRGTDAIDTSQRHRILHDLLRKQMASAFPLAISLDQNISTMSYPLFNGTETSMQFVSLNSLRFQDSPGLTLVRYDVNEDTDSDAYALVESEQRYLGQSTDSEETLDLFNSLILYGNLSSCTFAYRSPDNRQTSNINLNLNTNNAQEESEEWVSEWNGQEKGQLPIAIAMNLESMDENGDLQTRRIVVPIQATEEYSQTSSRSSSGISRQPRRGRSDGRGGSGRDRSGRIGPDRGGFGDMSGRGRRGGRGGMPGIGGRGGRGDMPGRGGRGGRGGMPGMGPGGMPGGSPFNGDRSSGGGRR